MWGSVGSVTDGAGVHGRQARRQREQRPVLPVQAAPQRQREGLLQRRAGGAVLVRLHHARGLLRKDRLPVAGGVPGQAGPSQRAEIPMHGQEILLRPLSVHRVFRTVPRLPALLHQLAAQRDALVRLQAADGPHQRGDAVILSL